MTQKHQKGEGERKVRSVSVTAMRANLKLIVEGMMRGRKNRPGVISVSATAMRADRTKEAVNAIKGDSSEYATNLIAKLGEKEGRMAVIEQLAGMAKENEGLFERIKYELRNNKDSEIRAGCAIVLGQTERQDARAVLTEVYQECVDNRVTDACFKALKQIYHANKNKN